MRQEVIVFGRRKKNLEKFHDELHKCSEYSRDYQPVELHDGVILVERDYDNVGDPQATCNNSYCLFY